MPGIAPYKAQLRLPPVWGIFPLRCTVTATFQLQCQVHPSPEIHSTHWSGQLVSIGLVYGVLVLMELVCNLISCASYSGALSLSRRAVLQLSKGLSALSQVQVTLRLKIRCDREMRIVARAR